MKPKGLLHLQLVTVCLVSCSLFALTACLEQKRRPDRYLIPNGYVGWVRINFKVKNAPALPTKDGVYLIEINPDGRLQTSSSNEYGWAQDEYYYYSESGQKPLKASGWDGGGMIWGAFTGSLQGDDETYESFFVGTEEQFRKLGLTNKDENGNPRVGHALVRQHLQEE